MTSTDSIKGRVILTVAHLAGMVDLVALPVWIGTLMEHYGLDAQRSGALVAIFLISVVGASLLFGPRFERLRAGTWAPAAYGLAGLAFGCIAFAHDYALMAALHALGGLAVGCGLSIVHGTIGRSRNPHRLWAFVGMALGVFAILILGGTPLAVRHFGGPALFVVLAGVMGAAAAACAMGFPEVGRLPPLEPTVAGTAVVSVPRGLRWVIAGVVCLTLMQSMLFSFVERIGTWREFGADRVLGVLILIGFINLMPAALAGLLQYRLPAPKVAVAGVTAQALLALTIALSPAFVPYAAATAVLPFVTIFTHNFVFGSMARLDPSGRTVALTPAMLMTGSASGPLLGGTLVLHFGYESLGLAAVVIACVGVFAFSRLFTAALKLPPLTRTGMAN